MMTLTPPATKATQEPAALHPFFSAGMGEGPYRFVGCFDLGEAMNPDSAANFGNMTGWIRNAPKLEAGMGTCACCGMAIMLICIIQNAAGLQYGVGSDCVEKADNAGICREGVRAAMARRTKEMARARREKARAAKFEAERPERERRQKEENARALAECKERYAGMERNRAVIVELYGEEAMALPGYRLEYGQGWGSEVYLDYSGHWMGGGGFRADLLATLLNGTPVHSISDRARRILADIRAKQAGRANSKAYLAAWDEAMALLFPKA